MMEQDVFTEVDGKINLDINNLNASCITSPNNAFSLDSEGNLVVNTITTSNPSTINFDAIYPVGSIYLSVNNVNPSNLFGGVWERINGYYLYAGEGGATNGSNTSGAASGNTGSTALTVNQIPSHTHSVKGTYDYAFTLSKAGEIDWFKSYNATNAKWAPTYFNGTTPSWSKLTALATGGGAGHTHTLNSHTHAVTPLRFEVYMWKRVS